MLVRMAVLKGKDPQQILEEMEIIDKQGVMSCVASSMYIVFSVCPVALLVVSQYTLPGCGDRRGLHSNPSLVGSFESALW